jgi:hypothetical protein
MNEGCPRLLHPDRQKRVFLLSPFPDFFTQLSIAMVTDKRLTMLADGLALIAWMSHSTGFCGLEPVEIRENPCPEVY